MAAMARADVSASARDAAPGGLLGQHRVFPSALLHLAPGAVAVLAYLFVCVPLAAALGLPRLLAFVLMDVLVLLPLLLACLLCLGRRRNGRFALDGVVLNQRKLPARQLVAFVLGLVVWALIVIGMLSWVDEVLLERVFYWVPVSLLPQVDMTGYAPALLIATHAASVAVVGIAAPIVEELYFRGFLLPRVSWMGGWAPVWNTVLFTGYHFWSPWRFVTRIIFSLPMVYAVWRKQSISIGIWWHCLGNTLGELLAFMAVLQAVASRGGAL